MGLHGGLGQILLASASSAHSGRLGWGLIAAVLLLLLSALLLAA